MEWIIKILEVIVWPFVVFALIGMAFQFMTGLLEAYKLMGFRIHIVRSDLNIPIKEDKK